MDSITFQRALGTAMKNKWIGQEKDKVSKTIYVFRKVCKLIYSKEFLILSNRLKK